MADVVRTDYSVASDEGELFVREVSPQTQQGSGFLLLVHGLSFPSIADFDLPRPGCSLCEYLAARGINCCIFDLRGYGKSYKPRYGRPVGMAERARDLAAVHRSLQSRHPGARVCLGGLSSGCNCVAEYLSVYDVRPSGLAFVAPCYLLNPAMAHVMRRARILRLLVALMGRPRSVYAVMSRGLLTRRLYKGEEELIDRDTFELFLSLSFEMTCPGKQSLRAPVLSYPDPSRASRPWATLFDAKALRSPLLVLRGDGDEFCCARCAEELARDASAKDSQVVTLAERKHDIHLYKKHDDYFETVYRFAERVVGPGANG